MSDSRHPDLLHAIQDEVFPEVDMALRRGRHVDRDDAEWYAFLSDASEHLEPFYRRFGCELVHKTDGFFYLLPTGDRLGRRHLALAEMLVGQALTLLMLEPATVQEGGMVRREQVLSQLAAVMGADALMRALAPKRKKFDERVAEATVRSRVHEALRRLAALGFVELMGEDTVRLRPALMRFAEPVRGSSEPVEELQRLVAQGEVVLLQPEDELASEAENGEPSE